MRCRSCDYPLWNLKARACPECGEAFLPSAFEFLSNSVRFCCPDCDQGYYGTSARGHLVPDEFDCVRCGRRLRMNEMVLRPTEGVTEERTRVDEMPWLERRRGKPVKAWLKTVGRSMTGPGRLIRATPSDAAVGAAWRYALLTIALILFIGGGLPFLLIGLGGTLFGDGDALEPCIIAAAITLGGTAAFMALIALWGAVAHGLLRVTGGAGHTIGRTYQALCFSSGANVTTAFPCLGLYPFLFVGLCWWIVSAILMVAVGQRVHGGRAALAVLALPVLLAVLGFAGMFGLAMWGVAQAPAQFNAIVTVQRTTETQLVLDALRDYASDHDGAGPVHGLELTLENGLTTFDLLSTASGSIEENVPVGGEDLAGLAVMRPATFALAVQAAIDEQPEGVVAHRLGDFVFTHHGIDIENADAGLWLVILSPDPDQPAAPFADDVTCVGTVDGTVEAISGDAFPEAFEAQNLLRSAVGLEALAPPEEIAHGAPQVGGN